MGKEKPRNSSGVLKRICLKLLVVALIIGIPAIILTASFYIKKVTVVGAQRYTPEEIKKEVIQSKLDSNSLYLYLKYRFFKKANMPFVEKIDVSMADNHSVNIYVYEKMVAGCVEFLGEYLYFDKDGIVVESSSKRLENVPVIKGLKFDKIILHEKLEVQKKELFDVIMNLTQLIDKYELKVDSVSFSRSYEVTLECGDNTVQLGKKDTYDVPLAELKNLLEKAGGMKLVIDMRNYEEGTDTIPAKPKE